MRRGWPLIGLLLAATASSPSPQDSTPTPEWKLDRPKVPGTLRLNMRSRAANGSEVRSVEDWVVAETAIIVCDMWDDIYCKEAARRIGVLVPKMNAVLTAARDHGVLVVHAPSDTMTMYADFPQRLRAKNAALARPPKPIESWCHRDPEREPELPLDTSKSPCDDPVTGAIVRRYSRQHPGLDIGGFDLISDDGKEIHNAFHALGIKNVVLMGVHTNMCVLGRSFGIRQLVRLGYRVALARDLTDAMYDPRQPPYVSHARGTELTVEHIERYWCPSLEGVDLTRVVPGTAGPR